MKNKSMTIGYFDLSSGVSGDMILGALIDAGLSVSWLTKIITCLSLDDLQAVVTRVERNKLPGVSVRLKGGRNLSIKEMFKKIARSGLRGSIKARAEKILHLLIESESHVHRTPKSNVHFHQLAEPDTLVDVVGASCGMEHFGIDRFIASSMRAGSVAPATAYLLKKMGAHIYAEECSLPDEIITPTGAAILAGFGVTFGSLPVMKVTAVGFGAGEKIFPDSRNLLSLTIGTGVQEPFISTEKVLCVQINIDDMDQRVYPYLMEKLFLCGALDVWFVPIQMKKGRPAMQVNVLCGPDKLQPVNDVLLRETTTLGLRFVAMDRVCLPRWKKGLQKYGRTGNHVKSNVELDDAISIARKKKIPLYEVLKTR